MTNTNYTPRGPERRQLLRTFKKTFWLMALAMFVLGWFAGSWNGTREMSEQIRTQLHNVECTDVVDTSGASASHR